VINRESLPAIESGGKAVGVDVEMAFMLVDIYIDGEPREFIRMEREKLHHHFRSLR
jgi:hypothetical protein